MDNSKIREGTACFLVKDKDLLSGRNSKIYIWLKENNFVYGGGKGWYSSVDWIYININSMSYAPGMPGVPLAPPIGNHAITFEEFKNIYSVYSKYIDLPVLRMSKEDELAWNETEKTIALENKKYWEETNFEKYICDLKTQFINYTGLSEKNVTHFFIEEKKFLRESFDKKRRPESMLETLNLMY